MAVPSLRALVASGYDVRYVVTGADKRRGRGGATAPSPVNVAALELGLDVGHRVDELLSQDVDLGIVVAFGQLIRRPVLERIPMVNVHFSLLPRWRGAAPVERALLAGDHETGTCLMQLDEGLDTGPVFDTVRVPIAPRDTAAALRARLVEVGTEQLLRCLARGLRDPQPQRGEPTYAAKLDRAELRLDWSRPAEELDRVVRVGGAWTVFRGTRLGVVATEPTMAAGEIGTLNHLVVTCGRGGLRLLTVRPEGRADMPAAAWANGARLVPGERLGDPVAAS
jgi:methionyl-tRNA formyltransferase